MSQDESQSPPSAAAPGYVKPSHASVGAAKPALRPVPQAPAQSPSQAQPGAALTAPPAYDPEAPPLYETIMQAAQEGGVVEQVRRVGMACRAPGGSCGGVWARVFDRTPDGHSSTYACVSCGGRWKVSVGGTFQY